MAFHKVFPTNNKTRASGIPQFHLSNHIVFLLCSLGLDLHGTEIRNETKMRNQVDGFVFSHKWKGTSI